MSSRYACLVLASVFVSLPAHAQDVLTIEVSPCLDVDAAAVEQRVLLEVGGSTGPARLAIEADCGAPACAGCEASEVSASRELRLRAERDGVRVERVLTIDDIRGESSAWALAVLLADLLERARRPRAESPAVATARAPDAARTADPPVVSHRTDAAAGAPFPQMLVGLDAGGRLHPVVPTLIGNVRVGLQLEWLRFGIEMGGSEVRAPLGVISLVHAGLEVSARPIYFATETVSVSGELGAFVAVVHARGLADDAATPRAEATYASFGPSVHGRFLWRVDPRLVLGLSAALGYDLLGADLRENETVVATTNGLRVSMDVGAYVPL